MHNSAIGAAIALKDVFIETGEKVQTHLFKIDGNGFTTVEGGHTLRLDFSPFSFSYLNGRPVKGSIDLYVDLVLSKSAMLTSGFSSFCGGALMEMYGQFRIRAYKEGQPLLLQKNARVSWLLPEGNYQGIEIFACAGSRNKTMVFQSDQSMDWGNSPAIKGKIRGHDGRSYYEFSIRNMDYWAIASMPFADLDRVMLSVRHQPMATPLIDTAAFLVLKHHKTVVRMFSGNKYFSAFNLPENLAAKILIFGTDGEHVYFGQKDIPKTCKSKYYVPVEMVSTMALKHYLQQLDI